MSLVLYEPEVRVLMEAMRLADMRKIKKVDH
jgi:hypothetical protein